jgi:hypothetical protein
MLATNDLQRSISKMTLDLSKSIDHQRHRADHYRLCERENQFQYQLSGQVGTAPVETLIGTPKDPFIPFDIMFVANPGQQRDSQLAVPQVRIGHEIIQGPAGLIPYAYVADWQVNANGHFIGAKVIAGVHAPAIALQGAGAVSSTFFKVTLHIAFQGYGTPIDTTDDYSQGSTLDTGDN